MQVLDTSQASVLMEPHRDVGSFSPVHIERKLHLGDRKEERELQSRGQKSGQPGSCPGPANPIKTWAKLFLSQWKFQNTKELLAGMVKCTLIDCLIETKCFNNRT